jgi:N-methylhydantoinase A
VGIRIGVDTGGTHTDIAVVDDEDGTISTIKVPTTPQDLNIGILDGVARICGQTGKAANDVSRFVYGTTLVTNLIVENDEIPLGLITTDGFRDILEIARASRRPNVYDIHWRPGAPLVRRDRRFGVRERIAYDGSVIEPLVEADVVEAADALAAKGVRAIAVCLLHSYVNPAHEKRIKEIIEERHPQIAVSVSSEIARELREYERTSTTAINAFVMAPIGRHLDALARELAAGGVVPAPYIMRGNGGVMSFGLAKRLPAAITHSGPMGGIIGGAEIARRCGLANVITLDMGGTSADVSLIANGTPTLTTKGTVGRHPLLVPMLDLVTIGAGGGSIAAIDAGGALMVGPRSAGSVPGPACYAQGGADPTVTDANLFAGRLNAAYFLAGARKLDPGLSQAAIARLADRGGLRVDEAALGILAIAEAHMVNAIKLVSVQRGLDPRDFTLIGFGGAGPLHTVKLAEELGIRHVVIPPAPGNVSALGLLAANVRHDLVRSHVRPLAAADPAAVEAAVTDLLEEGAQVLATEGTDEAGRRFVLTADLRYAGQAFDLNVPFTEAARADFTVLAGLFHLRHAEVYGYANPEKPVQFVNIRLSAIGAVPELPMFSPRQREGALRPAQHREVLIAAGRRESLPVYRLDDMAAGDRIEGPAIVEYPGSTLFLPPNWPAECDAHLNLHARIAP